VKKKVVLVGGGHGLSNLVKGFKNENVDLSIIVSSTDDGGHTQKIREEFGILAVGDLRMVLSELVDDSSAFKEFLDYRFDFLHGTSNVSLGNLMLSSMLLKHGDIDKVINSFKSNFGINVNIYMSANNSAILCAEDESGTIIKHERLIGKSNKKIKRLFVDNAMCNEEMLDEIKSADILVLAPGSLYTSIGAVICVDKIKQAILKSKATIVYVCNIMCQDGETANFDVNDHVCSLERIMGRKIDRVIINNGNVSEYILSKYKEENSSKVLCNDVKENYEFYDLIEIKDEKIRHNSEFVKKIILNQ